MTLFTDSFDDETTFAAFVHKWPGTPSTFSVHSGLFSDVPTVAGYAFGNAIKNFVGETAPSGAGDGSMDFTTGVVNENGVLGYAVDNGLFSCGFWFKIFGNVEDSLARQDLMMVNSGVSVDRGSYGTGFRFGCIIKIDIVTQLPFLRFQSFNSTSGLVETELDTPTFDTDAWVHIDIEAFIGDDGSLDGNPGYIECALDDGPATRVDVDFSKNDFFWPPIFGDERWQTASFYLPHHGDYQGQPSYFAIDHLYINDGPRKGALQIDTLIPVPASEIDALDPWSAEPVGPVYAAVDDGDDNDFHNTYAYSATPDVQTSIVRLSNTASVFGLIEGININLSYFNDDADGDHTFNVVFSKPNSQLTAVEIVDAPIIVPSAVIRHSFFLASDPQTRNLFNSTTIDEILVGFGAGDNFNLDKGFSFANLGVEPFVPGTAPYIRVVGGLLMLNEGQADPGSDPVAAEWTKDTHVVVVEDSPFNPNALIYLYQDGEDEPATAPTYQIEIETFLT